MWQPMAKAAPSDIAMRLVLALVLSWLSCCSGSPAVPSILLKNAAVPGTFYPMTGLGLNGPGFEIPTTATQPQCWKYPACCTESYCPAVNATRDWLAMGGTRIDTGFPYGDSSPLWGPVLGPTCAGASSGDDVARRRLGHQCDARGTRLGIEQSGVARDDLFITVKSGFAGPMMAIDEPYVPWIGKGQADWELAWLGLDYADLYLAHEGDLGNTGMEPASICAYPTTAACRLVVWRSCLGWMAKNRTRACGVANWELAWLEELVDANVTLPAVLQTKFHLHQSLASPRIRALKDFCDARGILFTGYSPLGRADWTRFNASVGTPTLLEEPLVRSIAARVGRSPAEVLLRWHAKLGVATQPRSTDPAHMAENLAVFGAWAAADLTDGDVAALSALPQCSEIRGDPFVEGDPEDKDREYRNMIGPTKTC